MPYRAVSCRILPYRAASCGAVVRRSWHGVVCRGVSCRIVALCLAHLRAPVALRADALASPDMRCDRGVGEGRMQHGCGELRGACWDQVLIELGLEARQYTTQLLGVALGVGWGGGSAAGRGDTDDGG